MKGKTDKLGFQSWAAHPRIGQGVRFRSDPHVWYTLKMRVDVAAGRRHVHGKTWKRGKPEPQAWTLEAFDPHPNVTGSPGLYLYSLAHCLV